MGKPRKAENRGLPARWRVLHGAYYYQVPKGLEEMWEGKQLFRLGKSLSEAYKVWAEKVGANDNQAKTIGQLLDRYALEVVPTKAPQTKASNQRAIPRLKAVFGAMPLGSIQPKHVYGYVSRRSKKVEGDDGKVTGGKVVAHREIEVLSHAFTKAVEWGYLNRHPFKNEVRLDGEKPRTRYVEDWEIVECLSLPAMRKRGSVGAVQSYIRLKLLTGLRRGDLLRLRISDCTDEGIRVTPHKTAGSSGKTTIYEWSPELRSAVDMARRARPVDIAPWLFCNHRGECYMDEETGEAYGWKSIWQRFMARVMAETKVVQHFTEHDLRAKVGSDAESRERARALLGHVDERITERVYRRKPERVKPLR